LKVRDEGEGEDDRQTDEKMKMRGEGGDERWEATFELWRLELGVRS
jgi:hypothetical protein